MLLSVGFSVWEATFINPHGWAFPPSSHRMLQGWYLQQDAETPCPRYGAKSSCKWCALFHPPVMFIQQGALQLWGIFCPSCSKPELRGLKLGPRGACNPVTGCENVPHQEFRGTILPLQRDGVQDLLPPTHPSPKCEHFVVPLSFPHFLHQHRGTTETAASQLLSLLCPPEQQVKSQCYLSHTKLPVSWVMLQGPFTEMCQKEIYAKISANIGRRQIGCICLSASKRSCYIWVMLLQKQHHKGRWVELAVSIKSQNMMNSQLKRKCPPSWQKNRASGITLSCSAILDWVMTLPLPRVRVFV